MQEPIRIELSLGVMFPSVNCYLVPGAPLTLVDCGVNTVENWTLLQQKIAEHGYKVSDIEQVLITHEHQDHIGLLPQIMEHSKAIIRAPKAIEGWFRRPEEMQAALYTFQEKLYSQVGFPKEMAENIKHWVAQMGTATRVKDLSRFEFFEEGEYIEMGHTQWEALNTPGHCPSQFVFLQAAEKRMFSSDMLLPIAPMPIVSEDPTQAGQTNRALKDLLVSFARLQTLNLQTIYPGHGPIFSDANAVIERQLARIEMRKMECLKWYQAGYTTVYAIHQKMYPYHQVPPNFSGLHMIIGYLDLLRAEGLIEKTIAQ